MIRELTLKLQRKKQIYIKKWVTWKSVNKKNPSTQKETNLTCCLTLKDMKWKPSCMEHVVFTAIGMVQNLLIHLHLMVRSIWYDFDTRTCGLVCMSVLDMICTCHWVNQRFQMIQTNLCFGPYSRVKFNYWYD